MQQQPISPNKAFLYLLVKYFKKDFKLNWFLIPHFILWAIIILLVPLLTQQISMTVAHTPVDPNALFLIRPWGLSITNLIIISIVVLIANTLNSFAYSLWSGFFGKRVETYLRNELLEKLIRQDISYYSDKKIGELLTNVISDSQIVGTWTVNVPMTLLSAMFQVIVALIMTFVLEWRIAVFGFGVFLLIVGAFALFYIKVNKKFAAVREILEDTNGNVIDRVISIRLIKATGTEAYETEYFKQAHVGYFNHLKPIGKWIGFLCMVVFTGDFIITLSVPILAIVIFKQGDDPSGIQNFMSAKFAAYVMSQRLLVAPLMGLFGIAGGFAMAGVSSMRILRTLQTTSRLDPNYDKGDVIDNLRGNIVFQDIEFRYPEKPEALVLPKFNFTFEYGKSYAFVGETGSGKSTVAKLLLRFYDPSAGVVLINERQDLRQLNLANYLDHIGYVEQEPQILFGDVFENVKYSRFAATNDDVIAACKQAELHSLIMSWPEGYNTILGERGFMLSGGQKQRLVIARMFLKNPELLILDEATSALDNIVEKEIQAKLNELMKGRTSVTIAHKLSTIKNCDHIVVLGGAGAGVVQQGTFNQLITQPGHFKNLYDAGLMGK